MKDAYYFPHDSNAHKDPKILGLRLRCGMEGVGIYWTLIELLRDCPTYKYPYDLATLELGLSLPQATLQATLQACFELGLLIKNDTFFSSPALDRRMSEMEAKRAIFKEAGRRGGIKSRQAQATLKPGLSHPQARKESKGKESKGKEIAVSPNGDKRTLTDLKKVVKGWKFLKGVPIEGDESKSWDRTHFARCSKSASQLLDLFGYPGAVHAMEYVFNWLESKKLDCTLETIVKHSDKYREVMDRGNGNGQSNASLPVIRDAIKTITRA